MEGKVDLIKALADLWIAAEKRADRAEAALREQLQAEQARIPSARPTWWSTGTDGPPPDLLSVIDEHGARWARKDARWSISSGASITWSDLLALHGPVRRAD